MGQTEVIKVLEKKEIWLTAEDISKVLGVENITLIRRALRKLYDWNEIFRKRTQTKRGNFLYTYKIK